MSGVECGGIKDWDGGRWGGFVGGDGDGTSELWVRARDHGH